MNSPVRAFGPVGGVPRFIDRAAGPYLSDVDGRQYVDLVCSWGPMILGHAHPAVVAAVSDALARGTSFGAATPGEVELAAEIIARAPVEQVRLVNSGTEATMSALRLARGYTGRALVVKFAGCYHGHVDALLVAAGFRRGHVRPARHARRNRRVRRRHHRASLQRRGGRQGGVRGARRGNRLRDHRGLPGEHGGRAARARVQRAARLAVRRPAPC